MFKWFNLSTTHCMLKRTLEDVWDTFMSDLKKLWKSFGTFSKMQPSFTSLVPKSQIFYTNLYKFI